MSKPKNRLTRRQFLKTAGLGIGAALAVKSIPALAASAPTTAALRTSQTTRAGVLRVGWEPVKKLDPAFISLDSEISFVNAVYDYLIDTTATDKLAPRLAESWSISDDGKVYTFNLVKGVKFHDGRPLTAADVIFSFDRLRDEKVGSPKASLYTNVASITAPDDFTVVFTLNTPEPDFLYNVADASAVIVPAGSDKLDTTFIGSGPFKVESYTPEDRAIFVANEEYWAAGLPRLAGMEHRYLEKNAAIDALQGGDLDLVLRMPNARYVALQSNPDLLTLNAATSGHDVLRLRVDQAPGNDPRVRKALKMATDRAQIAEFVQLGLGAVGRDAPIGPFFADYFDPESPLPPYDPEGAKKLLAEAGFAEGTLKFELNVPNSGGRPDFATVIKDQWAKAGIQVEILIQDEATYYADNGWLQVPMGITGWAPRPTPQQYLDFSFKSTGKWNETKINDPELDALITTAGSSLNREERIAAYKAIQKKMAEDGPVIIAYFFPLVGAARKAFSFEDGFNPFAGLTDFRRAAVTG